MRKLKPNHDLHAVQELFNSADTLSITGAALRGAAELGYEKADIVSVVQQLVPGDFVKSETAHTPRNSRVWHDTYVAPFDRRQLYLKFAGETLVDVTLVSFKERRR